MADGLNGLVRLTKTHIKPAAETVAKAFYDYPLSVYFVPDVSKRLKRQATAFRNLLHLGTQYGEVYATSLRMEGVVVWFPPDYQSKTPPRQSFFPRLLASLFADKVQRKRAQVFTEYANEVRKHVVPGRHWYLQLLAVDPAHQGKGFSSRLLKPMLARAEREGLPVYLETQSGKNVALYEHFGFRVAEEGVIPGSDIKSWAMVRDNVH